MVTQRLPTPPPSRLLRRTSARNARLHVVPTDYHPLEGGIDKAPVCASDLRISSGSWPVPTYCSTWRFSVESKSGRVLTKRHLTERTQAGGSMRADRKHRQEPRRSLWEQILRAPLPRER